MGYLEALLYGFVQGITEYLPVSSSAHLILLPRFLEIEDPGLAFDVFLHLGTLFATLIYFRSDWIELLHPKKMALNFRKTYGVSLITIAIATLPALLFGALLHSKIETVFRGVGVIVFTQIIGGVLLYVVDRFCERKKSIGEMNLKNALLVGLFQCLSLVPGMSRSGSTMTGGRFLGFDRQAAARFSFLMSAPITAAAIGYELLKNGAALFEGTISLGVLLTAAFSTFVFGWLAIDFLLKWLGRASFLAFTIYRVGLAAVVYFVFRPF